MRRDESTFCLLCLHRSHRYPLWAALCAFGMSDALLGCQQFDSNDLTSALSLVACSGFFGVPAFAQAVSLPWSQW
jgi:hypothetical protein